MQNRRQRFRIHQWMGNTKARGLWGRTLPRVLLQALTWYIMVWSKWYPDKEQRSDFLKKCYSERGVGHFQVCANRNESNVTHLYTNKNKYDKPRHPTKHDEWNELIGDADIAMMLAARFTIIRWRVKRTDVSRASFSLTMTPTLIVFTQTPATNIKLEKATWMTNKEWDILYSPSFSDIFLSEDISCLQLKKKIKTDCVKPKTSKLILYKKNPAVTG